MSLFINRCIRFSLLRVALDTLGCKQDRGVFQLAVVPAGSSVLQKRRLSGRLSVVRLMLWALLVQEEPGRSVSIAHHQLQGS